MLIRGRRERRMKTSFVRKVSDVESVPCRLVESCYRRGRFSRASMIDQSTLQRDETNYDVQNQSEN
jgi:hypothetical protein